MKQTIVFLLLLHAYVFVFSQEYDPYTYQNIDKPKHLTDKIFFGGGFGMQFGTVTLIKISPEIGFRLTEKTDIGTGLYYLYAKNSYYQYSEKVFGGKLFSRFYITPNFFLTAEYELMNIPDYDLYSGQKNGKRIYINGLPAGIGWKQQLGTRFAVITSLLYNVLQNEKTPYSNPIFRLSFIY